MLWISVKDRLPQRGEEVLVWIEYSPVSPGRAMGHHQLATFRLKRHEWDEDYEGPDRPKRIVISDPHFHWSGGDADCSWCQSNDFAEDHAYSENVNFKAKVTHWMPLPASPSGWTPPLEETRYWEEENENESS